MRKTLSNAQSGSIFQNYNAIGWLDQDFDLGVIDDKDGNPDHWFVYFTLKTFGNDGNLVRVNCRADGSLAYTLQSELQRNDRIYISGYLVHQYDAKLSTMANKVHITGYAFLDDLQGEEVPPYSEEKALWMKKCEKLFDSAAPLPTLEDAKTARENWLARKKKTKKKAE
jgi:hypothetical protein